MTNRIAAISGLWWALVVGLGSCSAVPLSCLTDAQCRQHGGVDAPWCVTGACQPCRDDSHCEKRLGQNWICESSTCVRARGYCAGEPEACGEHQVCRYGRCEPECGLDEKCASGLTCVEGQCVCECASDDECALAFVCADGCTCTLDAFGDPTLHFDFGESALTTASRAELRWVAAHHAASWPALRLACAAAELDPGHQLTAERARVVTHALGAEGVAPAAIYVRLHSGGDVVDSPARAATCSFERVRRLY